MMVFYSYILPCITRSRNDNHNNKFIEWYTNANINKRRDMVGDVEMKALAK